MSELGFWQNIIDGHDSAARISENDLHTLPLKRFEQKLRARFGLAVFQDLSVLFGKLCGCGHDFILPSRAFARLASCS